MIPACVDVHGSTYDAVFGYQSSVTGGVTIPVGANNHLSFDDGVQITLFNPTPGDTQVTEAFRVTGISITETVTWSVTHGGHPPSIARADASFGRARTDNLPNEEPDGEITPFVNCVGNHGSTYDAVFGYNSENVVPKTIPIGEGANDFSPAPLDRGQGELSSPVYTRRRSSREA